MSPDPPRLTLCTAPTPGAVAIIQVTADPIEPWLTQLTSTSDWPTGKIILTNLGGVDRGIAVKLNDHSAQLMPHGGPLVVRELIAHILGLGAVYDPSPSPHETYPEALSGLEADMLAHLARAASPAAVDLLLTQPHAWNNWKSQQPSSTAPAQILTRSHVLDHLITPPTVVVIGRPNVGKSTLTNRMLGRSASLVADLSGTTRDWVSGLATLTPDTPDGDARSVAVRWLDTPGLRDTNDPIEHRAIELAASVIRQAHTIIALRDPDTDWPNLALPDADPPLTPHLWVVNKIDEPPETTPPAELGAHPDHPLPISAKLNHGIDALQARILELLGLATIQTAEPWAFSDTLRDLVKRGDTDRLTAYLQPTAGTKTFEQPSSD